MLARSVLSLKLFFRPFWVIHFALVIAVVMPAHANMVIVPIWDTTITGDPAYSTITNTIMQAIAVYEGTFSDNITVYIKFEEMPEGLGESEYYDNTISYSMYRSYLAADASTIYDTNALAHLPKTTANPVNGSDSVRVHLANGRAIGLTGQTTNGLNITNVVWNSSDSQPDGIVFLNTSIMNLTRPPTNYSDYDLFSVASHEIDEVLGIDSALSGLTNGQAAPTGTIATFDLFRYDQNGNRSFNTISNSLAYFSLDGTTLLVQFNQYDEGDFNDWYSWPYGGNPPRVQDAFSTPGATPDLNVELIALDVLGYNLLIPKIAIAKSAGGTETVSWSPAVPQFILQETTNLASTNWINAPSGTNDPAIITNTTPIQFYRIGHE